MEGTAGADGTDVASTGGGGEDGGGGSEHIITMQHNCVYVGFTACHVMSVLLL